MIQFFEEKGWEIFNGNIKGDEEGEYTFTGGNGNMIDIVGGGGKRMGRGAKGVWKRERCRSFLQRLGEVEEAEKMEEKEVAGMAVGRDEGENNRNSKGSGKGGGR